MTPTELLALHIDQPSARHRLTLRPDGKLRCHDCCHTLPVPATTTHPAFTSTSTPPPLHAPDRCPEHPGQYRGSCGACRAEALEATEPRPAPAPTADVAAGAAAARAALAPRRQEPTP